jgi:hypothetical protein
MSKLSPLPHVRTDSIHHPPLCARPLLRLPDRLLVRWSELIASPSGLIPGWPTTRSGPAKAHRVGQGVGRGTRAVRSSDNVLRFAANCRITECHGALHHGALKLTKPAAVCRGVHEGYPRGGMVMMVVIGTRASKQWSGGFAAVSVEEDAR